jgi:pyruvate dehydrogenase E1 component
MEGLFRQIGIYSNAGQLTSPSIRKRCYYKEASDGQILEEGITERVDVVVHRRRHGIFHARRQHDFFIYYSMFGFQRIGDLYGLLPTRDARLHAGRHRGKRRRWRARTPAPGRQQPAVCHGHPNCIAYDPAFAHEIAVIIQTASSVGCRSGQRLLLPTVMNEQYVMPLMPQGA